MLTNAEFGDEARLAAAFPDSQREDVLAALTLLPSESLAKPNGSLVSHGSIDGRQIPAHVKIGQEPILIPSRIYHDALLPGDIGLDVPPLERTVVGCLYTRHHSGYVRQYWLREIVGSGEPWVVPFVVQLLGEYVIEIIVDIVRAPPELTSPGSTQSVQYGHFLAANPQFFDLTRQRVASYWDCYFRGQFPNRSHYPGVILLAALTVAAKDYGTTGAIL